MSDFWEEQERLEQEYDRHQNEIAEAYEQGYNKAIDDFVENAITMINATDCRLDDRAIYHIRAELKGGGKNDD